MIEDLPQFLPEEPHIPCPVSAADDLRSSGATDSDVLDWTQKLLASFTSTGTDNSLASEFTGGCALDSSREEDISGLGL